MKQCPSCQRQFSDQYAFCLKDGTPLTEVVAFQPLPPPIPAAGETPCRKCSASIPASYQFCKKCGTPKEAVAAPPFSSSLETTAPHTPANKLVVWLAGGAVGLLLLLGVGGYWYFSRATERKLDKAIAAGNLFAPPGENAYELYHQLKNEGATPEKLTRLKQQLLPLIKPHSEKLLADLVSPGARQNTTPSEWEQAAKEMTWAAELDSDDKSLEARKIYCRGRVEYLSNNKEAAINYWQQAAELDSSWALPMNSIGLAYNELKNYPTAREHLFQAIQRDPDWPLPYNNVGTSYYFEKNYVDAADYYQRAVDRSPNWARPHAWLGEIAMRQQDYQRAVQEFEIVLDSSSFGTENMNLDKIRATLEKARQMSPVYSEEEIE
jgi:tetratricopeptide (TPR) repeat protein